ncbi:hypothetical protein [Metaclostridioides mangenotii]|nr:hypothetical protein [Clostridioides mangenotii]
MEGEEDAINIESERTLTKIEKSTLIENKFVRGDMSLEDYKSQMNIK